MSYFESMMGLRAGVADRYSSATQPADSERPLWKSVGDFVQASEDDQGEVWRSKVGEAIAG